MQYENEKDRKNERTVASALARRLGKQYIKLDPLLYGCDYVLTSDAMHDIRGCMGAPYAFIEIKCRTTTSEQFDYYMVSAGKWTRLVALAAAYKPQIHVWLVVKFADRALYVDVRKTSGILGIGSRGDWRCEYDKEPMVFIPMDMFIRFKK